MVEAHTLRRGDEIVREGVHVTILRDAENTRDYFGRPMIRFYARRHDTDEEGYMTFGKKGLVRRVLTLQLDKDQS